MPAKLDWLSPGHSDIGGRTEGHPEYQHVSLVYGSFADGRWCIHIHFPTVTHLLLDGLIISPQNVNAHASNSLSSTEKKGFLFNTGEAVQFSCLEYARARAFH